MDWNLIIGTILLYIGVGLGYSQWIVDYSLFHGHTVKPSLLHVYLFAIFKPILKFRMKFNI